MAGDITGIDESKVDEVHPGYDREKWQTTLSEIEQRVNEGQSCVVFGPKRMGKTEYLLALRDNPEYLIVDCDAQITVGIRKNSPVPSVEKVCEWLLIFAGARGERNDLEAVKEALEAKAGEAKTAGKKMVVLFDEWQYFRNSPELVALYQDLGNWIAGRNDMAGVHALVAEPSFEKQPQEIFPELFNNPRIAFFDTLKGAIKSQ